MRLRRLTEQGIARFSEFLDSLGRSPLPQRPESLLTDPEATEEVRPSIEVEQRIFGSRFAAAEYLFKLFKGSGLTEIEHDKGLWAWLSLFYFEELCPADGRGRRKPGRRERWLLVPTSRRFYLHQLAGPFQIYRAHNHNPAITIGLLCGPLNILPRVYEEVAESPALISNPSVVETATRLYYDPKTGKIRRNISSRGGARRYVEVLAQFDVTWDLASLSAKDVWSLLPEEFAKFKQSYETGSFDILAAKSALIPQVAT